METSRNCPSRPEPYPQNWGHHVPQWKELQGIHFDHFVGWLHAGIASFSEQLVCSLVFWPWNHPGPSYLTIRHFSLCFALQPNVTLPCCRISGIVVSKLKAQISHCDFYLNAILLIVDGMFPFFLLWDTFATAIIIWGSVANVQWYMLNSFRLKSDKQISSQNIRLNKSIDFLSCTHLTTAAAAPRQCLTNAWWVLVWSGWVGRQKNRLAE